MNRKPIVKVVSARILRTNIPSISNPGCFEENVRYEYIQDKNTHISSATLVKSQHTPLNTYYSLNTYRVSPFLSCRRYLRKPKDSKKKKYHCRIQSSPPFTSFLEHLNHPKMTPTCPHFSSTEFSGLSWWLKMRDTSFYATSAFSSSSSKGRVCLAKRMAWWWWLYSKDQSSCFIVTVAAAHSVGEETTLD